MNRRIYYSYWVLFKNSNSGFVLTILAIAFVMTRTLSFLIHYYGDSCVAEVAMHCRHFSNIPLANGLVCVLINWSYPMSETFG